jgi:hypothetical protein
LDAWPFESFGVHEDHWRTEKVAGDFVDIIARAWNRFSNWRYALHSRLCPRLLICEIEPIFCFDLNPRRRRERALTDWITL